jgi:hypothetical protein
MQKLKRTDLMSLEDYASKRPDYRKEVLAHKANRQLSLGEHAKLYFEDRMTIQYQIQEMLRIERIFEADGINEELDAYNPLIPDGSNWKATFMLEYDDVAERQRELEKLVGIEDKVWLQVDGCEKTFAIADEDLDRATEEKTSAVHFMRFELADDMIAALKNGAALSAGIDHSACQQHIEKVADNIRDALTADLD